MKTAEDYIKQINDHLMPHPYNLSRKQREEVKSLIREIQREAYNEALVDAAILGKVEYVMVQSGDHPVYEYRIDRRSIMKLKKEL